jgi:hypothetical protein
MDSGTAAGIAENISPPAAIDPSPFPGPQAEPISAFLRKIVGGWKSRVPDVMFAENQIAS